MAKSPSSSPLSLNCQEKEKSLSSSLTNAKPSKPMGSTSPIPSSPSLEQEKEIEKTEERLRKLKSQARQSRNGIFTNDELDVFLI